MMKNDPVPLPLRFSPVGECALLVELGDEILLDTCRQVWGLDRQMRQEPLRGVDFWVPAYTSLLVHYDPGVVTPAQVRSWIEASSHGKQLSSADQPNRVVIPVRYGGESGPDLDSVAKAHNLTPAQVVEKHTQPVYRVGMMGFMPGFAYLIGLDPVLATPRRDTPRTFVPADSVGIAGNQTGVYPLESPGGWQIIGRTELSLFNPSKQAPFLLSPGDEVQFVALKDGAVL
jgi:KipI family sensor histidine kinase inhibitor